MRTRPWSTWSAGLVVVALLPIAIVAVAVYGAIRGWDSRAVAATLGLAAAGAGVATVRWAKSAGGGAESEEERHQKGPSRPARRRLLGLGAGAALLGAGLLAGPAARRVEDAKARLSSTRWGRGIRVVDANGRFVMAGTLPVGELMTVYPEGAIGVADSQAVLIKEPPERFAEDPERADWVVDGIAVYSKLCTHMACPLGLYQQSAGTLLCPCHQAVFDVLDGGRAIQGPARRALPQLPIEVDAQGYVVARGDFSDHVGASYWNRP